MPSKKKSVIITPRQSGQRLDVFCANLLSQHSRSKLQQAIKAGDITVNNKIVKPHFSLHANDQVFIQLKQQPTTQPNSTTLPNITILYEDNDLVVINKPAGVLVHPTSLNETNTVADWFIKRYPKAASVGEDESRPGIVHRLDKDTSGVMVLAKNSTSYQKIKQQFKKHRIKKEYLALVFNVPKAKEGRITRPLVRSRRNPSRRTVSSQDHDGKPAITQWQLEKSWQQKYALLKTFPLTGRTHQIRVHLHHLGHPIIGDPLYTFKRLKPPAGTTRQLLHAAQLSLTLPSGKHKTFSAPLPDDFQQILDQLNSSTPNNNKTKSPLGFRTPSSFKAKKQ